MGSVPGELARNIENGRELAPEKTSKDASCYEKPSVDPYLEGQ